jgi:hypothetical protein
MAKAIYFDMDGTLANLYDVENWLEKLRVYDATPYKEAKVMLNMQALAYRLNKLQAKGYTIGIITWLSKDTTPEYDKAVMLEKLAWLKRHLSSVKWNEIHIVTYGKEKSKFAKRKNGYLFDDNEKVRRNWIKNNPNGWAFDVKDILHTLDLMK